VSTHSRDETTLVFIHGWGFNATVWDTTIARLPDHYRCLAVDLPGYDGHRPCEGEYSLSVLAQSVLDRAPPDAVWVGWSLGGTVALAAAARAPGRVRAVSLVATTPRFIRTAAWPHGLPPAVLQGFARDLEKDPARTVSRFITLQSQGAQGARQVTRTLRQILHHRPTASPGTLRHGLAILRDTDLRRSLHSTACPVQLLLGERDTLVPAKVSEDLHTLCPAWTISVLPGAGHAPFLSHPEEYCRTLEAFVDAHR